MSKETIWALRVMATLVVILLCFTISWMFGTDFSQRGHNLGMTWVFATIFGLSVFFVPPWVELRKKWWDE